MSYLRRSVAIMMPFGGNDPTNQRRSILDFLRIKYVLQNKVVVHPKTRLTDKIDYEVKRVEAGGGPITPEAMKQIRDADVLIGLITDQNANVVFELALRCILRDIPILIVKEDLTNPVPIYLRDVEYLKLTKGQDGNIQKQCEQAATNIQLPLDVNDATPPQAVAIAIDKGDDLLPSLQKTLQRVEEDQPPKTLPWVPELFGDLHPASALSNWDNDYYPLSIVMQKWHKRSNHFEYAPSDADGPAIVCSWNRKFLEMYDLSQQAAKTTDLTLEELLKLLYDDAKPGDQLINEKDYIEFVKNQSELTHEIVFGVSTASRASVPLRFNKRHPNLTFRMREFLPCVIARKVVGDVNRPHCMYLVVSYIEVTSNLVVDGSHGEASNEHVLGATK